MMDYYWNAPGGSNNPPGSDNRTGNWAEPDFVEQTTNASAILGDAYANLLEWNGSVINGSPVTMTGVDTSQYHLMSNLQIYTGSGEIQYFPYVDKAAQGEGDIDSVFTEPNTSHNLTYFHITGPQAANGNQASPTPTTADEDVYIRNFRIWTCSSNASAACTHAALSPGSPPAYN